MADTEFIRVLGLIVVTAAMLVMVGRRFGVPSIISAMVAGFLLGPVLGLVSTSEAAAGGGTDSLGLIAELGIVLLLFLVGLELSLDEIREVGLVAVVAALGQSAVMGLLVFGVGMAFGLSVNLTAILAIAIGLSSTVVVVKQLEDRGELERRYGRISIGVLLVQDLLVIIVLTVIAGIGRAAAGSGADDGLDPLAIGLAIVRAFALMVILLGLTIVCARFVLPQLFSRLGRAPGAGLVAALAWCFVMVELAYVMGLSVEIGAFLAGMGLGRMSHRSDLQRRVKPLMAFFIAVFFASLGARIDLEDLRRHWLLGLVLVALVLGLKPPLFAWLTRRMGTDRRSSVDVGVTLMQISEFSLILGTSALAVPGILAPDDAGVISLLGVVALVTMVVSVLLMNARPRLHALLGTAADPGIAGRVDAGRAAMPDPADPAAVTSSHGVAPSGHVVVVGMNAMGRRIVRELAARGDRVVAVDTDAAKLAGLPGLRVRGDIDDPATRGEVGFADCRLAVCALRTEEGNRLFVHRCRVMGVRCVVHAFDRALGPVLRAMGPDHVIDAKGEADREVASFLAGVGGSSPADEDVRERGRPGASDFREPAD